MSSETLCCYILMLMPKPRHRVCFPWSGVGEGPWLKMQVYIFQLRLPKVSGLVGCWSLKVNNKKALFCWTAKGKWPGSNTYTKAGQFTGVLPPACQSPPRLILPTQIPFCALNLSTKRMLAHQTKLKNQTSRLPGQAPVLSQTEHISLNLCRLLLGNCGWFCSLQIRGLSIPGFLCRGQIWILHANPMQQRRDKRSPFTDDA